MIFETISNISFVPFPTLSSSFTTNFQTSERCGLAATHRLTTSLRVSSVPCYFSNFNHHVQTSSRSLSCANARPNYPWALSILRSDRKILATVQITNSLSFVFRRASAERVFLAGRGSTVLIVNRTLGILVDLKIPVQWPLTERGGGRSYLEQAPCRPSHKSHHPTSPRHQPLHVQFLQSACQGPQRGTLGVLLQACSVHGVSSRVILLGCPWIV